MRIFRNRYALLEAKADQQKLIDWVGQELADEFFAKRKLLKSPENDIYYWLKKEPQELADFLSRPLTKKQKEQTELEQILAMPSANDVDLVSKQDGYEIYKINSPAASVKYGLVVGGRAKWCISGAYAENGRDMEGRGILQEAERYLDFYEYEDYFFIIGHGTKYALCITSYAPLSYDIFDQDDARLSSDESQDSIPYLTDVYYEGDLICGHIPEFEIKNGVLVKYRGNDTDVVVPDDVREIGESAFEYHYSLTSVTLPKVQKIGKGAFSECRLLNSVSSPQVQTIGEEAFYGCESLTNVGMPNVKTIGGEAFKYCNSLTDIVLNPNAEIDSLAFYATPIEQDVKERFGLTERYCRKRRRR